MKKNIKLSLVLAGYALLNSQAFGDSTTSTLSSSRGTSVVAAINQLQQTTVKLFNDTFNGTFDNTGTLTGLSTLDTKINMYSKNYYSLYATTNFTDLGLSKKNEDTDIAVKKLLSQEIGYNIQNDQMKKSRDTNALLAIPIEKEKNNIDNTSLGLNTENKDNAPTPYGSIDDNAQTADNAPNFNDLIGKDSYADSKEQNQAKLFISYLLKSAPPPRTFYIPNKSEAIDGKVAIYLPYPSADSPYTILPGGVSIKPDSSGTSEYDRMVTYLNKNSKYYQKYKMKTRATNVARTLYLGNLFRIYQERIKNLTDKNDKSLVEREKEMAFATMDKKYYDDLKNKSIADITLETLRAINKQNYFLYKIHQDNERSSLMTEITALQLLSSDTQDDLTYIKPIGAIFTNRCWNISKDSSAELQKTCADPASAALKQMSQ